MQENAIYIVATPIGNLDDFSKRAVDVLNNVDLILCEDTRRSKILLNHYRIKTKLRSFHKFNEKKTISQMNKILSEHKKIALISDAGTPLISDPGSALVEYAVSRQVPLIPIPGASSLSTLLSISALPHTKPEFSFIGFLDHRDAAKRKKLEEFLLNGSNVIFFESANRVNKSLEIISEIDPKASVVLARELTKINEEILFFTVENKPQIKEKGEITILVIPSIKVRKTRKVEEKNPTRKLASLLASHLDVDVSTAYDIIIRLKEEQKEA